MNIQLKATVTCDQTGKTTDLAIKDMGPISLRDVLRKLIKTGWSVSTWRDENGNFATHSISGDGWKLFQDRPDGTKFEIKNGLSRKDLWITAPGIEAAPPFYKSSLALIELREKRLVEDSLSSPRVEALESQVAYLTAQIQRLTREAA